MFVSTSLPQPLSLANLTEPLTVRGDVEQPAATSDVGRLTRLLRSGDEGAFREFHGWYFDRLYQFLLVVARGNEEEAREALQETLIRVARRCRVFEEEEAFWCWLKAVARNVARDGGRRRSRYTALLRKFAIHRPDEVVSRPLGREGELMAVMVECLSELQDEDRRLLEGKYLRGSTVKELAQAMEQTDKAVESRLGRLRQRLREAVLCKLKAS